jgi:hypothetical protein
LPFATKQININNAEFIDAVIKGSGELEIEKRRDFKLFAFFEFLDTL